MTREIKANLVFIIALLIVATPGLFIMVRKRMERSDHPGGDFMRSIVPNSVAFNQPPPYRPDLPKFEPPAARSWVEKEIGQRLPAGTRMPRGKDQLPIMSDNSRLQLLATHTQSADLLLWDKPTNLKLTPAPASMETAILSVPKEVRHALQDVGYVNPPEEIEWLSCTWAVPITPLHLQATYTDPARQPIVETLDYQP